MTEKLDKFFTKIGQQYEGKFKLNIGFNIFMFAEDVRLYDKIKPLGYTDFAMARLMFVLEIIQNQFYFSYRPYIKRKFDGTTYANVSTHRFFLNVPLFKHLMIRLSNDKDTAQLFAESRLDNQNISSEINNIAEYMYFSDNLKKTISIEHKVNNFKYTLFFTSNFVIDKVQDQLLKINNEENAKEENEKSFGLLFDTKIKKQDIFVVGSTSTKNHQWECLNLITTLSISHIISLCLNLKYNLQKDYIDSMFYAVLPVINLCNRINSRLQTFNKLFGTFLAIKFNFDHDKTLGKQTAFCFKNIKITFDIFLCFNLIQLMLSIIFFHNNVEFAFTPLLFYPVMLDNIQKDYKVILTKNRNKHKSIFLS